MKTNLTFLFLLLFFYFPTLAQENYDKPARTTIHGKLNNFDPDKRSVTLHVNRPGLRSLAVISEIDSMGYFTFHFDQYTPTDAWIGYHTNFRVLTYPGDSLYVEFNNHRRRPAILKTVKFKGNGAQRNKEAAAFQLLYYDNPFYHDWSSRNLAIKELNEQEYLLYLDTVQLQGVAIFDRFVAENDPMPDVKKWAYMDVISEYYVRLGDYPSDHISANGIEWWKNPQDIPWDVSDDYFESITGFLPLDEEYFINGYALSSLIRVLGSYSVFKQKGKETDGVYAVLPGGGLMTGYDIDSLKISFILETIHDPAIRQMMLAGIFYNAIDKEKPEALDKFADVFEEYITFPYLREPLSEMYEETRKRLVNPQIYTGMTLKQLNDLDPENVFSTILEENKGKVLYIDTWATWCGPCLAEMPESKKLMTELEGKDVTFVFLCIESKENIWRSMLDKMELPGVHYLLDIEQSRTLRSTFEINGIPFYFLVDRNGNITSKGSHLRPNTVKNEIKKLLK